MDTAGIQHYWDDTTQSGYNLSNHAMTGYPLKSDNGANINHILGADTKVIVHVLSLFLICKSCWIKLNILCYIYCDIVTIIMRSRKDGGKAQKSDQAFDAGNFDSWNIIGNI